LIDEIIKLNPTNHAPVANAGGPYVANESSTIMFNAAASSDADGDALQYRWDFDNDGTWDTTFSGDRFFMFAWHDDWTGTVRVAVSDGCEASEATASVTVKNVPPTVTMTTIADGEPFILTYLVVNFVATFTDPGLDTFGASIAWQGGNPPVTQRSLVTSPVSDSRVYTAPGTYGVTFTVQDDDGGVGQATTSVHILTPQGATAVGIAELKLIAGSRDVIEAIANLEGQNGGKARNGALDEIVKGNSNAALVKLQKALESLMAAEQSSPGLNLTKYKQLFVNIGRSMAVEMIAKAEAAGTAPVKVEQAKAFLAQGVVLQNAGDDVGALMRFQDAARRVLGVI
jgi:PKD repeat protein